MAIRVKQGGTWKNAAPRIKHAGVWKTPVSMWRKAAGVWKKVWPDIAPMEGWIEPSTAMWDRPGFGPQVTMTAYASGGVGPYTYSWNDTGNSPSPGYYSQTVTWTGNVGTDGSFASCYIEDSLGNNVSPAVTIDPYLM